MDDILCIVCGCDPEGVCDFTSYYGAYCPLNPWAVPLPPSAPANDEPMLRVSDGHDD